VEAALLLLFQERKGPAKKKLPPLPIFDGGKPLVDIADREELYDILD